MQRTKASPLELARKRFPRPSATELNEALFSSLSFLIVREPFERLLSGYRNKLESRRNKYYKLLGDQIIKDFRKGNKRVSNFLLDAALFFALLSLLFQIYVTFCTVFELHSPFFSLVASLHRCIKREQFHLFSCSLSKLYFTNCSCSALNMTYRLLFQSISLYPFFGLETAWTNIQRIYFIFNR